MRFEILPGLPAYGPRAINFTIHGEREHREGLVVRFHPQDSEPWVGNFMGGMTTCTAVLEHPNKTDVIVVARGEASIIDPNHRTIRDRIADDIEEVISAPSLGLLVFRGMIDFKAIRADNSGWRSPRISWDGLRNIKVRDSELFGEAYTPVQDGWVPFKLDLLTGHCSDGIYESEMTRAVRVSASPTDENVGWAKAPRRRAHHLKSIILGRWARFALLTLRILRYVRRY